MARLTQITKIIRQRIGLSSAGLYPFDPSVTDPIELLDSAGVTLMDSSGIALASSE